MELSREDEENPHLDGDYKALLKRRRAIAAAAAQDRLRSLTVAADVATAATASAVAFRTFGVSAAKPDGLRTARLCDALFTAAEKGDVRTLSVLCATVKSERLRLHDQELRQPGSGETPLHRALRCGRDEAARLLAAGGGESLVTATMIVVVGGAESDVTCLHFASEFCSLATVRQLTEVIGNASERASFLQRDTLVLPKGQRARNLNCLHIAAQSGKADVVRYFVVECGMSVNAKNNKGDTPLLWAANDGRAEVVELLVALGAAVDEQNDKGSSALHWAVRGRHLSVAQLLLGKGKANVNIRRKQGLVCPIAMAAALGYNDVVQLLIGHGADVCTTIHNGETALHYAAGEGATDVCQTLIAAGAGVNVADNRGQTPIVAAAAHGHVDTVLFLLREGADVHAANLDGVSVWSYAVERDSSEMLAALLVHSHLWHAGPAIANSNDSVTEAAATAARASVPTVRKAALSFRRGRTPLHLAAARGDLSKVAMMLGHGLNPESADSFGRTFVHLAAMHQQADVIRLQCTEAIAGAIDDAGNTPLHLACRHGCAEAIAALVKKSNLQARNAEGKTPLHEVARAKATPPSSIQLLVTHIIQGHDWSLLDAQDKDGNTALHAAAAADHVDAVHVLKPLSVTVVNKDGDTPLHVAVARRHRAVITTLLKDRNLGFGNGSALDLVNNEKETAICVALRNKDAHTIELLIRAGADLCARGRKGRTFLHELTRQIVADADASDTYREIVNIIVDLSPLWWSAKNSGRPTRGVALTCLFLETVDDKRRNVLQYACKTGCALLVDCILNVPGVLRSEATDDGVGDAAFLTELRYDVTDVMPATRSSTAAAAAAAVEAERRDGSERDGGRAERRSLLELIVSNRKSAAAAAAVLDVEPLRSIVADYWSTYQWLFGLLMLAHVTHMSLLSYFGPQLLAVSVQTCGANFSQFADYMGSCPSTKRSGTLAVVVAECVLLVGPSVTLIFESFVAVRTLASSSSPLSSAANLLLRRLGGQTSGAPAGSAAKLDDAGGRAMLRACGSLGSAATLAWYALYRLGSPGQDYLLAVALAVGWIFTLHFTQGFHSINHFNLVVQRMLFRDVAKFLLLFVFFLLGFGMARFVMTRHSPGNGQLNVVQMLFATFNWQTGMNGFWNKPSPSSTADAALQLPRYVFAAVLFIIYCIVAKIVLGNMLIASMTDSYGEVSSARGLRWRLSSVRLALDIEKLLPPLAKLAHSVRVRRAPFERDSSSSSGGRWFYVMRGTAMEEAAAAAESWGDVDERKDDEPDDATRLESKVQRLQADLATLGVATRQLAADVLQTDRDLDAIATKLKAITNER